MPARRPLLIACLALLLAPAMAPAFDWESASPASMGMDALTLNSMTPRYISGELGDVDGVMVIRGGKVVYQQ